MNEDIEGVWLPEEALVQLLLTSPGEGFISIADAEPPRHAWRHVISPFVGGLIEPAMEYGERRRGPLRSWWKRNFGSVAGFSPAKHTSTWEVRRGGLHGAE